MPYDKTLPPGTPPSAGKLPRLRAAFRAVRWWISLGAREHFWDLLDLLDRRPKLKRNLLVGIPAAVAIVAAGYWGHSQWSRTHALAIGRQWLAAGRLDRAAIAARSVLRAAPRAPASWQFAAAVAWKCGMKAQALDDLQTAATLSQDLPEALLDWADAAILAEDSAQAGRALALLPPGEAGRSGRAARTTGEWLRRKGSVGEAAGQFQHAVDLDRQASLPSLAIDEIPLGVTLLATGRDGDHARGVDLLTHWSADPAWGAQALRELLTDAIGRKDPAAMVRWAQALRVSPRFSEADIFDCLRGTAAADPRRFQAMLFSLEQSAGTNRERVAQLMGCLNRLGRTTETLAWAGLIPVGVVRRPPIATEVAEALRLSGQWQALTLHVGRCEWGRNLEFLGSLYSLVAARQLGDPAATAAKWQSVQSFSQWSGGHALVAADLLYSWGDEADAINLLWTAADGSMAPVPALATLERIYQVRRDAVGQYRVFARLAALRPDDRDIGNNLAYFAAVTGRLNDTSVARIAQANFEALPGNLYYRCTWAFVLSGLSRPGEALRVLQPVSADWRTSRAIAWAYVAALSGLDRKDEAKEVLRAGPIRPDALSLQEISWMQTAVK